MATNEAQSQRGAIVSINAGVVSNVEVSKLNHFYSEYFRNLLRLILNIESKIPAF